MAGLMGADVLAVFVKEPRPGAVKSRLAAALGAEAAAEVYRAIAEEAMRRTAPRRDEYDRIVAFDPPSAGATIGEWLGVTAGALLPQPTGDIGLRMERVFDELFRRGARRVALIGTDVPALSREDVRGALESLDDHDVAVGPATDGGYYLLALKRPEPELLRDVPWSTPDVLTTTLDRAARLGLSVRVLWTIGDVDTIEDLAAEWGTIRSLLNEEIAQRIDRTIRGRATKIDRRG
ncbi:MAG TPA: TIGR04282 family arsenosugar biosynthesis glycosyltransferase [Vicinamibacteria bacterium]|nr:TIGR04282 family arsenosugar biosynthesis glycosyltransferase [Vicinamibacteria bacterium]